LNRCRTDKEAPMGAGRSDRPKAVRSTATATLSGSSWSSRYGAAARSSHAPAAATCSARRRTTYGLGASPAPADVISAHHVSVLIQRSRPGLTADGHAPNLTNRERRAVTAELARADVGSALGDVTHSSGIMKHKCFDRGPLRGPALQLIPAWRVPSVR
jgi:hypothetical protein